MFSSLKAALKWGAFDAVIIMLPHHLHEDYATQCLQAGKHVLLEKPMAHSLEACARLLQAVEASPQVFMVGENSQFWPEVREKREGLHAVSCTNLNEYYVLLGVQGEGADSEWSDWRASLCTGQLLGDLCQVKKCMQFHVIYSMQSGLSSPVCSSPFFQAESVRESSHWRFDPAKAGGGIMMDGATHWIRPLRVWYDNVYSLAAMQWLHVVCL